MGRSRSATLVIMYILYKLKVEHASEVNQDIFNTELVSKFVQYKREVVDPNKGFLKCIIEFEEMI